MAFGIPNTQQFPWDVPLARHLAQGNDSVYGGMNTWATAPTVGVDGAALGVAHTGYTGLNTSTNTLQRWNGSSWDSYFNSLKPIKQTSISFYLDSVNGSDSNTGLTSTTAVRTPDKLYSTLLDYVFLDSEITIYLAAGTYDLIRLPITLQNMKVNLVGVSSSQVIVGGLRGPSLSNSVSDMTLTVKGISFSYTGSLTTYTLVSVSGGAINLGPDIVFDQVPSSGVYIAASGSMINFYPNCPVTIKGNPSACFTAIQSSYIQPRVYIAPPTVQGAIPSLIPTLTPSDTTCVINFIGARAPGSIFHLESNSTLTTEYLLGRMYITGNVTGIPYNLFVGSYSRSSTAVGVPGVNTYGFPSTMSAGYVSADSTFFGTRGI